MDTSPSPSSLSSLTTKDEFEELEVAEFEANALWELLHDEPARVEGEAPKQATEEVTNSTTNTAVESYWCLNNNNDNNTVQDFDWFDMMEETSIPCNDMGGWYGEPCMEEILEIGDYSFSHTSHTALFSDEIGYIGLWQ